MLMVLNGCFVLNGKKVSKLSDIKYGEATETMSDSMLYAYITSIPSFNGKSIETLSSSSNILFYPDQTVCYFRLNDDSLHIYNVYNSLDKCIKKEGRMWGVYHKEDSMIFTEVYGKSLMFNLTWEIQKDVFLLLNDTLVLKKRTYFGIDGEIMNEFNNLNGRFIGIPTTSKLPQTNHFLKKKKWIWKNISDWKKYMDSYKRESQKRGL